jgi:hypothetical protein
MAPRAIARADPGEHKGDLMDFVTRRFRRRVMLAALLPLALFAAACDGSAMGASDVSLIEWTSSFGFCLPEAYCTTRLQVDGRQAVLTLESRQSPPIRTETQLSAAEADALAEAAAEARFDELPPVVGCPDCADGGAESVRVVADGGEETVTFEYNAALEELEPLLGRLRALVERLRPAA